MTAAAWLLGIAGAAVITLAVVAVTAGINRGQGPTDDELRRFFDEEDPR